MHDLFGSRRQSEIFASRLVFVRFRENGHQLLERREVFALLRRRDDFYRSGHPTPADVLLLIEVSDSSLSFDRSQKLPRYAAAGIPEVWIVNRPDGRIESYMDPVNDAYATVQHYGPGESIAPQAFPDIVLEVTRIIGD